MLNATLNTIFEGPPEWGVIAILSVVSGCLTAVGSDRSLRDCELQSGRWPLWFGIFGTFLTAAYLLAVFQYSVQSTPEVAPSLIGIRLRILSHLSLLILLLMITATDLKDYAILEWTCWLGMLIGVLGAALAGELQIAHVWVDWNEEIPQLRGPYIPGWLAMHPHLHGLAWSVAGLLTGAMLTWCVRFISSKILQMNTLGSGDIYLMAMIGAFIGWQPTVVAFLLAPLFALLIGGVLKLTSNRPALPYGPFLALGAITVLFTWKWLWMAEFALSDQISSDRLSSFATRRFFGDPLSMLVVIGGATFLFVVLLGLLKLYHSLPLNN